MAGAHTGVMMGGLSVADRKRLDAFEASMPSSYREAFALDHEAIDAHAAIVLRREASKARTLVEIWKELPERIVAICIVADDRPGLLSQISAALVALDIDVVTAHAYCRTREDGAKEAVDLLWIRRVAEKSGEVRPIRAPDVVAIGDMVDALVGGTIPPPAVRLAPAKRSSAATRVRFEDVAGDGTMVLTVEATDRPGLLLLVTKAIFRAELQIIGLRAMSEEDRAIDRFHLAELDGTPLRQARLLSLQVEILGALEADASDATLPTTM